MAATEVIRFRFGTQAIRRGRSSTLKPSSLFRHSPACGVAHSIVQLLDPRSRFAGICVSPQFDNGSNSPLQSRAEMRIRMRKARLYDANLLANRGIDVAVQGLERIKYSGLEASCFENKLPLFEIHRASFNGHLCNNVGRNEDFDLARFEKMHRESETNGLDEVHVYRSLGVVEERRRIEGKPPKVRFFTQEEQREWERQCPKSPELAGDEVSRGTRP
jgi:hypothetical protein